MPETQETMPQRITLDGVTVRHIQIHDSLFGENYKPILDAKYLRP